MSAATVAEHYASRIALALTDFGCTVVDFDLPPWVLKTYGVGFLDTLSDRLATIHQLQLRPGVRRKYTEAWGTGSDVEPDAHVADQITISR